MLVLSRNVSQAIYVGEDIKIVVVGVQCPNGKARVRIGIDAPKDVAIVREEIRRTQGDRRKER